MSATIPRASADESGADEYGTAAIRRRVLAAWAASPARFREDANAEEDAALGAYRDRLVVELLQNAVDAATEAGVPARVHVRLRTDGGGTPDYAGNGPATPGGPAGLLEIANTGAPLTAAGVEALSTLRASAKRDAAAVGRFGAGFAAVLAVSDIPSIVSRSDAGIGGVGWSRTRAIEAVAALTTDGEQPRPGPPGIAEELARRDGAVPILRLPFDLASPPPPPDGYDTVVRLPLRDLAAQKTARDLIATLDRTLPLVLGGPAELVIDLDGDLQLRTCRWWAGDPGAPAAGPAVPATHPVDPVELTAGPRQRVEVADLDGERWRGIVRRGTIPADLLADRPVEERGRNRFTARVMVRDGGWPEDVPQLVRAPQPTDEPLSLPVLASIELPLDPSRRHTIAGPLRDWLTTQLAQATAALAGYLGTGLAPTDGEAINSGSTDGGHAPDGPPDPLAALALVPSGLPLGEVDGRLRDTLSGLLSEAPMLPGGRLGRECSVCDLGPATDTVTDLLLSEWDEPGPAPAPDGSGAVAEPVLEADPAVAGLLPAAYAARRWRSALAALGVRRLDSAALVELLTGISRSPAWWGRLYAVLIAAPDRDALGALPVPIVDVAPAWAEDAPDPLDPRGAGAPAELRTRLVTGPRGTLLPTDDLDVVALARSGLPLRVVHPDACTGGARDALRTLGALEGTPAGVLRDPAVREAVLDSDPDDVPADLTALAEAVLALVRDAGDESSAELSWLGDLLLPDGDGAFEPAAELLVGGGPLDRVLAEDAPFGTLDPALAAAWPAEVLAKVGVLDSFGVLRADDLPLDADEQILLELDDSDTWVDDVAADDRGGVAPSPNLRRPPPGGPPAPSMIRVFAAVRDLELVDPRAWPEALAELARRPLRDVVFAPEPAYTRWWLARHAVLPVDRTQAGSEAGRELALPPGELILPGADPLLTGLFSPAAPVPGVDAEFLRHLGARLTLEDVLGDLPAVMDLLDRLGDADRDVEWPAARTLYIAAVDAVARVASSPDASTDVRFDPPLTVRTPDGVVPSSAAVIVDAPDLLGLIGADRSALRLPLDRAAEVAAVLGVPLAAELGDCELARSTTTGQHRRAPDGTPYQEHPVLLAENLDGEETRVPWRVLGGIGGEVHTDAAAGPDALARALAWRSGQWDRRHALAAALRDPGGADVRAAEDDLDET